MTASGTPDSEASNADIDQTGHWFTSPVSRRQFVVGAGGAAMLAGLSACGGGSGSNTNSSSGGGSTGSPKRGGNFRLGVTGGGSKDIFDGQNIVTKPDQARLVSAFETLLTFDENYQLRTTASLRASRPTTRSSTRSSCARASSSRTARP